MELIFVRTQRIYPSMTYLCKRPLGMGFVQGNWSSLSLPVQTCIMLWVWETCRVSDHYSRIPLSRAPLTRENQLVALAPWTPNFSDPPLATAHMTEPVIWKSITQLISNLVYAFVGWLFRTDSLLGQKCWFFIIWKSIHTIQFKLGVHTYWVSVQNWLAFGPRFWLLSEKLFTHYNSNLVSALIGWVFKID